MAKRQSDDLRRWAVLGAEQRLVQLGEEARAIFRYFPELRRSGRGFQARSGAPPFPRRRPSVGDSTSAGESQPKRRRRRKISREARRLISEAQKKRWAELKAKQGTSTSPAEATAKPKPRGRARKKR